MADPQRHYRDALVAKVRRPLADARHHAVTHLVLQVAEHADELHLRRDALVRPLLERLLPPLRCQTINKWLLHRVDLDLGRGRAAVGRTDLDHLGYAGVAEVLDELPGHQSAGAVAHQDDLLVAQLLQSGHRLSQTALLNDDVNRDIFSVSEGEDIRLALKCLDQETVGFLPRAKGRLAHRVIAQMGDEAVNEDDRPRLVRRACQLAAGWDRPDLL